MIVLGVETSCDETGLALVDGRRILAQSLATQEAVHALFGGVVPEIASREHLRHLPALANALIERAGIPLSAVDGIAVARGPGLAGALLVGLGFAKGLAQALGKPLVGINHCHAHLLAVGLEAEIPYPALGLLVSGGHTQLYRMQSPASFVLLGTTLDDAAGEAFDKVAKLANLPYPGGRHVDALGVSVEPDPAMFTRPYVDNDSLDFSFSGLKTAVATHLREARGLRLPKLGATGLDPVDFPELARMLASFNHTVAETLKIKTQRALARMGDARALVVSGGVAANSRIREVMGHVAKGAGVSLLMPSPALCTDNGLMIAHAGELLLTMGLRHDTRLDAVPRGRPVPHDYIRGENVLATQC